jgi:hypothetical protein
VTKQEKAQAKRNFRAARLNPPPTKYAILNVTNKGSATRTLWERLKEAARRAAV